MFFFVIRTQLCFFTIYFILLFIKAKQIKENVYKKNTFVIAER